MAGLTIRTLWCLLAAVLSPLHAVMGTVNPEWCSRQCRCMNSYVTADCARRGITTVPAFSNLTINLYLENNHVEEINNETFRSLENLAVLNLENNSLTTVSSEHFCGLPKLRILNLSHNKLRSFIISQNVSEECRMLSLQQLILSANQLKYVSPNMPLWSPFLETLNISFNQLNSALFNKTFSSLQSLRVLDLRGNHIYEITVEEFSSLKAIPLNTLSLSECGLHHVEPEAFEGMSELVSLSLSRNPLTYGVLVDVFSAIGKSNHLAQVDLREMVLPNITVAMLGILTNLTALDLFESSVKYIEPELFNQLPNLESLDVGNNEIQQLDNIQALGNLRRLHANRNHLTSINLAELDKLEEIDLSGNKFEILPAQWLGAKENLYLMNMSHNEITSIHPESLQGLMLQILDLSYNKITQLNGTRLTKLRKMYLSHNQLSSLNPKTFFNLEDTLEELDLSHNNLSRLPPQQPTDFINLQELNLNNNNLGQGLAAGELAGYFQNMGLLHKLDLSGNSITSVARHQLMYLHHLTTMDLSQNSVASLGDVSLHEVTTLAKLVITDNLIRAVDTDTLLKMEYLEEVDLSANPFNCAKCDIYPFLSWVNNTAVMVLNQLDRDVYQCNSPSDLRGQYLFDYHPAPAPEDTKCKQVEHKRRTNLDWAMVIVAMVGVTVFLVLAGVLIFYTQICHKIKSLHYRWQVRYREVSGVEFTNEATKA